MISSASQRPTILGAPNPLPNRKNPPTPHTQQTNSAAAPPPSQIHNRALPDFFLALERGASSSSSALRFFLERGPLSSSSSSSRRFVLGRGFSSSSSIPTS